MRLLFSIWNESQPCVFLEEYVDYASWWHHTIGPPWFHIENNRLVDTVGAYFGARHIDLWAYLIIFDMKWRSTMRIRLRRRRLRKLMTSCNWSSSILFSVWNQGGRILMQVDDIMQLIFEYIIFDVKSRWAYSYASWRHQSIDLLVYGRRDACCNLFSTKFLNDLDVFADFDYLLP